MTSLKRLISITTILAPLVLAAPLTRNPQFRATAGHTLTGDFCACGTPQCLCDPGETPLAATTQTPKHTTHVEPFLPLILIAAAFALWVTIRARHL